MSTFPVYKVKKCLLKSGKVKSALIRKSQLVSEKSTQRFAQLCPTPWVLMPKVVGHLCPSYRSFVPIVSVICAHRIGHSYPSFRSFVLMFMVIHAHARGQYFCTFCVPV